MADDRETLRIAVGLTRRATILLQGAGLPERAAELEQVIEATLEANDWLRDNEMSPELACLTAGIPLDVGPIDVLEEVPPPAELQPLGATGSSVRLVWREGR